MSVFDLTAAWLAQLAEEAAAQDLQFDTRFVSAFPDLCPICGQRPSRRTPYPGVVLQTYHDVPARRVVPFWACKPCGQVSPADLSPEQQELFTLRVRHRIDEFLI